MFNMMEECSRRFTDYFISQESETINVELKDIFTRYTNDEFYRMGKAYANVNGAALFKVFFYSIFTTPMKVMKRAPLLQSFINALCLVTRCKGVP